MTYNIQQPSVPNAEDKWSAAEHNGNLMLFFPVEVRRGIKTSNGDADAVRCSRVANLDTGRVLHDTLIFGTALVPNIGGGAPDGIVLGRLGQGQGKNGNNPPWILLPHDEQDLARAQQWLAQDAAGQLTQPQQQAPAQNGYGQPPAQQYGQQNAAQAGWGQQAPQAQPPAQNGYGAPQGQSQFAGQWGNAQPAPPAQQQAPQGQWGAPSQGQAPAQGGPAPAAAGNGSQPADPRLVDALRRKGHQLQPGQGQNEALQLWALVQNNPDVTA